MLPPLSLPLAEAAYADRKEVAVTDRHKGKWFGRPLHVRSAGPFAASWIEAFILHYEQAWAGTLSATGRASRHAELSLGHRYHVARYVESAGRRIGAAACTLHYCAYLPQPPPAADAETMPAWCCLRPQVSPSAGSPRSHGTPARSATSPPALPTAPPCTWRPRPPSTT